MKNQGILQCCDIEMVQNIGQNNKEIEIPRWEKADLKNTSGSPIKLIMESSEDRKKQGRKAIIKYEMKIL